MLGCQTRAFEWQSSGYSSMVEYYTDKVGAGGSIPPIRAKYVLKLVVWRNGIRTSLWIDALYFYKISLF